MPRATFIPLTADEPTIVAQATPQGYSGVAVLRLSGSDAFAIAETLFSRSLTQAEHAKALFGWVHQPHQSTQIIDQVLLLPFKAPASFTGEDVVEIHCHGGLTIPTQVLAACNQAGATFAPPGAFTRRAFINGKLDLTQAESILDAIHAEGQQLTQFATQNLRHKTVAGYLTQLREAIIAIQCELVACMDYPEEVEEPPREQLQQRLQALVDKARSLCESTAKSQWIRDGLKIAILGQPNAGKSTLFNALLAEERSIVTPLAGTTRDTISETLVLAGVPVKLVDTAGLRATTDVVEQLGVERSLAAAAQADCLLYLVDSTSVGDDTTLLPEADTTLLNQLLQHQPQKPLLKLLTKQDLSPFQPQNLQGLLGAGWHPLSVTSGAGLTTVLAWLETTIAQQLQATTVANTQGVQLCLTSRQQACLLGMTHHLTIAIETFAETAFPIDMATVPLTDALRQLDDLLGIDTAEAVLDSVFSQFCVGK
jgi:tRNA modification GTPase